MRLAGVARSVPSASRQVRVGAPRSSIASTAVWSPTVVSIRPSASSPIVGTASSSSSDALVPRRAAAPSSALAICLLTLRLVTFAFIRPRPANAASVSIEPSAAAQVLASRSSRAILSPRPEVPNTTPSVETRSMAQSVPVSAAAQSTPRRTSTLRSWKLGTGIW